MSQVWTPRRLLPMIWVQGQYSAALDILWLQGDSSPADYAAVRVMELKPDGIFMAMDWYATGCTSMWGHAYV